jgi:ribonuclease HI
MTENWFGTEKELPEKVGIKNIVLMFDGGAKPNPGKGYGSYSFKEKGENWDIYRKIEEPYGDNITSPQAEYTAIIKASKSVKKLVGTNINLEIYGDCELVVKQVTGEYRVKDTKLKEMNRELMSILNSFHSFKIEKIDRDDIVAKFGH